MNTLQLIAKEHAEFWLRTTRTAMGVIGDSLALALGSLGELLDRGLPPTDPAQRHRSITVHRNPPFWPITTIDGEDYYVLEGQIYSVPGEDLMTWKFRPPGDVDVVAPDDNWPPPDLADVGADAPPLDHIHIECPWCDKWFEGTQEASFAWIDDHIETHKHEAGGHGSE